MPTFSLIWFGQVISLIGTGLTHFALGIWVYQTTGSTTQFALIYLFTELPAILVAPIAGIIADRYNRRWVMIFSDTGSGLATLAIAILLSFGKLEIWEIYLAMSISSVCKGFQKPVYYATPTLLVSPQNFGRANGMIQISKAVGYLLSPFIAGLLLAKIQIQGVIYLDFTTYLFALATLLIIRLPKIKKSEAKPSPSQTFWQQIIFGWNYIRARAGLLVMLLFFMIINFTIGLVQVLIIPMVLGFSDAQVLGTILSFGGSGWLIGGIFMRVWGGFQRQILGVFIFEFCLGLAVLIAGLRPSVILITLAAFGFFFSVPMIISSSNSIWQSKVPLEIQRKVFALRDAIAWFSFPLAYLIAGPLAEHVFQPLLVPGGLLTTSVGRVIGVGTGRGIGLLFILIGMFIMLATVAIYRYPPVRLIEEQLPDAVLNSDEIPSVQKWAR